MTTAQMFKVGLLVCLVTVVGCNAQVASADTGGTPARPVGEAASEVTVVLVADMSEANSSCGCVEIIRSVRAAGKEGLRVREIDTRDKKALADATAKYRVSRQPSVLVVDVGEREVRRFEGESSETLAALGAELQRLVKRP